jgi:hypothetical protein
VFLVCCHVHRFENESILSTLNLPEVFVGINLYENLLDQGGEVIAFISLSDMHADGQSQMPTSYKSACLRQIASHPG